MDESWEEPSWFGRGVLNCYPYHIQTTIRIDSHRLNFMLWLTVHHSTQYYSINDPNIQCVPKPTHCKGGKSWERFNHSINDVSGRFAIAHPVVNEENEEKTPNLIWGTPLFGCWAGGAALTTTDGDAGGSAAGNEGGSGNEGGGPLGIHGVWRWNPYRIHRKSLTISTVYDLKR